MTDTGVFDGDHYWDVIAEYAKASPDDILIRLTVANRGPEPARLHLLPTLWFRNTWSWGAAYEEGRWPKPQLSRADDHSAIAQHATLGRFRLTADDLPDGRSPEFLFTENETNTQLLFAAPNESPHTKNDFHDYVVQGRNDAARRDGGTKAAALYVIDLPARGEQTVQLRLTAESEVNAQPFRDFKRAFAKRQADADAFYAE
ncbi:MAG: Mannosyl oligosaccharide glucosidase, partial [Planctomycetaceae bacterium]|nr:Mannosyl oligosaccharide glucosidase [Planctomycetaceae bacterium]